MLEMKKEGFWTGIQLKYPLMFADFSRWVDEYKRRIYWVTYFKGGMQEIKFHDLPQAMQIGVFLQYTIEQGDYIYATLVDNPARIDAFITAIERWFQMSEMSLLKNS